MRGPLSDVAVRRALQTRAGICVTVADVLDAEGSALAADLGARARFAHLDVTAEDSSGRSERAR
ncbi:hypothetical protein [Streptacidiphilus rugosus]|uniref:hypothetical protein n=1 Tax=Streptacidiphilus rugosus TaxID=405783 RepID=UPI0018DC7F72|nr:hypothetical protein [Streptacidiphilus rugosus]